MKMLIKLIRKKYKK